MEGTAAAGAGGADVAEGGSPGESSGGDSNEGGAADDGVGGDGALGGTAGADSGEGGSGGEPVQMIFNPDDDGATDTMSARFRFTKGGDSPKCLTMTTPSQVKMAACADDDEQQQFFIDSTTDGHVQVRIARRAPARCRGDDPRERGQRLARLRIGP